MDTTNSRKRLRSVDDASTAKYSDKASHTEIIQSIFDDAKMTISNTGFKYKVIMNNIECVEIDIHDEDRRIMVKSIFRCSDNSDIVGSGKYIIAKLIELSENLDYALVIEYDVSRIFANIFDKEKFIIPLGKLRLLSTGKTWYNSMGFYEKCYPVMKGCIDKYIQNTTMTIKYDKNIFNTEFQNKVLEYTGLTLPKSGTVKDVFTNINRIIDKLIRSWSDINLPNKEQILSKYRAVILSHMQKLEEACNKQVSSSKCYIGKKFNDLTYSRTEPTKIDDTPLPTGQRDEVLQPLTGQRDEVLQPLTARFGGKKKNTTRKVRRSKNQ